MKRILAAIVSLLILTAMLSPAYAADSVALDGGYELVMDEADLLTDGEEAALLEMAKEITERQHCDVVLVTVDDLGYKTAEAYADDYFDYNGYGYGPDRSGILFLISMADRDWHISTRGDAIQAFTDDGIEYLVDQLISDLSGGYYFDAFRTYFDTADTMLSVYNGTATEEEQESFNEGLSDYVEEHGHWGDESGTRSARLGIPGSILISLILGFLIAFIPMAVLKSQVNNVKRQSGAASYVRKDSMHLDVSRDLYLYANTTSRVIETEHRSGGGGSSTHISSSGATHGGHGGKF